MARAIKTIGVSCLNGTEFTFHKTSVFNDEGKKENQWAPWAYPPGSYWCVLIPSPAGVTEQKALLEYFKKEGPKDKFLKKNDGLWPDTLKFIDAQIEKATPAPVTPKAPRASAKKTEGDGTTTKAASPEATEAASKITNLAKLRDKVNEKKSPSRKAASKE